VEFVIDLVDPQGKLKGLHLLAQIMQGDNPPVVVSSGILNVVERKGASSITYAGEIGLGPDRGKASVTFFFGPEREKIGPFDVVLE
jgi:hypothetical protein